MMEIGSPPKGRFERMMSSMSVKITTHAQQELRAATVAFAKQLTE